MFHPRRLLALPLLLALSAWTSAQVPGTVASYQKLSKTSGNLGASIHLFDNFGISVAAVGDLDGDGLSEIAAGAWKDDDGGTNRGAVWIVFPNADGTSKGESKISSTSGSFAGPLADNDDFGSSCEGIGDLDGDGVPDLAVGSPGDDDGAGGAGAVWILFLNPDGTVKASSKISSTAGGFGLGLDQDDNFGQAVLAPGDLDGDGVGDLVVGAQNDDDGGLDRGAIWILYMNTDGTVKGKQKISSTQGGFSGALSAGDSFGCSLALLDDLDGDGNREIAVGASRANGGGFWRGAAWVLFLDETQTVVNQVEIGNGVGGFPAILDDQDRFGLGLTSIQDIDGDGQRELVVGAPKDDTGGFNHGVAYILFLDPDGTVRDRITIGDGVGGFTAALDDGDEFARGVAALPDLDGDGHEELIAGAPNDDDGGMTLGVDFGAFYILTLEQNCAPASATFRADAAGQNLTGYFAPPPVLGQDWLPTVDNTGTGNSLVLVIGYASPLDVFVPGVGSILVNIADPGGELTGGPIGVGTGVVQLDLPLPSSPSLCGIPLSTQGVSFGGGASIKLHNAYDLVLGGL